MTTIAIPQRFRIRPLVVVASAAFALLAVLLLHRCRRSPDLCAHEYDRYAFHDCQPCDPRTDELQREADEGVERWLRWNRAAFGHTDWGNNN